MRIAYRSRISCLGVAIRSGGSRLDRADAAFEACSASLFGWRVLHRPRVGLLFGVAVSMVLVSGFGKLREAGYGWQRLSGRRRPTSGRVMTAGRAMTAWPAPAVSPDRSAWREMFWQAFIRSSNPMALMDHRRRFIEVNGASLQLLGYSRDELVGMHFSDISATGQVFRQREWERVLKQGQFIGVRELKRADGVTIRVEFAGHIETFTRRPLVLLVAIRSSRGSRKLHPRKERLVSSGVLTTRELEVVSLIAAGYSGPEIAERLQLSHNTVRTHTRNAMDKTGARTRAHLVAKVLTEGTLWLEPERWDPREVTAAAG